MIPSSYSETPCERDLRQLIEQRDKALADAAAPINTRFKIAAEQLLRRATQAGDLDAANKIKAAMGSDTQATTLEAVTNARKQLAGTTWNAVPGATLRGGLAGTLHFTETTVEPGGYQYKADGRMVTITFTGGDKQVMTLTKGGKRLQFTYGKKEYAYEMRLP